MTDKEKREVVQSLFKDFKNRDQTYEQYTIQDTSSGMIWKFSLSCVPYKRIKTEKKQEDQNE